MTIHGFNAGKAWNAFKEFGATAGKTIAKLPGKLFNMKNVNKCCAAVAKPFKTLAESRENNGAFTSHHNVQTAPRTTSVVSGQTVAKQHFTASTVHPSSVQNHVEDDPFQPSVNLGPKRNNDNFKPTNEDNEYIPRGQPYQLVRPNITPNIANSPPQLFHGGMPVLRGVGRIHAESRTAKMTLQSLEIPEKNQQIIQARLLERPETHIGIIRASLSNPDSYVLEMKMTNEEGDIEFQTATIPKDNFVMTVENLETHFDIKILNGPLEHS